jgi:hypothetical protein
MSEMISIVVPCFDEQEVLRQTHRRLISVLEILWLAWNMVMWGKKEIPGHARPISSSG